MSQKRAEAAERKGMKQSREPESGEVKSQHSGCLVGKRSSFRRERAWRWCDAGRGRRKEPGTPMLMAGLTTTATKSKKNARTLADTQLELEVISQCGSGVLDDYKLSRTNMARMKLEGQLDLVEYSRITAPESVHMGDPAGGYVEMLKARNSARGHLMAWSEEQAMHAYLKELTEYFNLNRKEYNTVMSLEANEIGLKKLLEISWRAAMQKYFDETMHAPATVAAYLAYLCTRTDLQILLAWCLMGFKKAEYEANIDSNLKEQELELMEA